MKQLDDLLSELRQRNVNLWLEDERLCYRAAKHSLTPELLTQLKIRKTEIIDFLRKITAANSSQIPPIVPCERNGNLPLSFGQQRLWLLHQFEPDSSSNNMPVAVRFTGNLNVTVLEESLREVVRRQEVLRTIFPAVNGKPTQAIATDISLALPILDLAKIPPAEREAEALRLATAEAQKPFDLANGPILRVLLLRLSDREHMLIWNMHCIICDGASSDVFYQDLTTIYRAFSSGKPSPLPPLPLQYVDFAHWQHQWLQGEVLESQLNYWRQKLEGDLPTIELPYNHPRPIGAQTYRGDRAPLLLSKTLNHALTDLSQKWGVTLFITLLTVFELLLYRYSGQEELLISFASLGRGQVETERLIGFFSNTLVLRSNFAGNPTFRELLDRVRQNCLEAYTHQDLPFEKLVEELKPEQNPHRSPLFQVKFSLNPPWSNGRGMASVKLPDLTITSLFGYLYHGKTKYDLTLVMREQDNGLGMVFDYNADMFDASTINSMLGHFKTLLEGIVANPDRRISELPLLTADERHQLLVDWRGNQVDYASDTSIHQWFESQAQVTPNNIAIIFATQKLTYQELNHRANQLAHHLQTLGVGAGVLVGLYVKPSLEMIVGLLGILKAGGAYVPIALTSSQDRLAFILEDAQVSLLLTQRSLVGKLPEHQIPVVCLDTDGDAIALHGTENLASVATKQTLACVIYVSSPIGNPNGIAINHRNLVTHSQALSETWDLTGSDRILLISSVSSDAFIESLFPSWITGASVIIQSRQIQNYQEQFFPFIAQNRITVVNFPTFIWYKIITNLSQSQLPDSLRLVMVGGEKVSQAAYLSWVEQVGKGVRWLNVYGTIETTFTATVYDPETATEATSDQKELPIGKPIANTQIYILDRQLQLLPIGVTGEIYISGIGVAQGYFNRTDLTSEKFIPNPFSSESGTYLYKSGDLGRYLSDGNIEFVGRLDNQAKICGLRIELAEIETILAQYPGVDKTVVIAREDVPNEQRIVAYIVPKQEQSRDTLVSEQLLNFLQQKLPEYMLPSAFKILDSLPLNANGKVDYKALPAINPTQSETNKIFATAEDRLQLQLTKIWENVLGIHPIGLKDNFFELGGHSLVAVRMFSQIEKTFGKNLPLAILFKAPTIEQLSYILREEGCLISWSALVPIQANGSKPPLFLIHPIGGNVLEYSTLARYLGKDQPIYGLQSLGLDGKQEPPNRIEDMASSYLKEIYTIQPNGPYFITGYSFGGLVAFEIAQQLYIQGEKVAMLALMDIAAPNIQINPPTLAKFLRVHLSNLCQLPSQEKLSYIQDWLKWHLSNQNFRDAFLKNWPEVLENLDIIKVIDANIQAADNYKIQVHPGQVYPGKINLFRSTVQQVKFSDHPDLGWREVVGENLEIIHLNGEHTRLLKEPYVQKLATKLKLYLDRAMDGYQPRGQLDT